MSVEYALMPQLMQHEDITIGLGAVVFRGKGVRARSSNRPIEAINQRFEVFGFELIKAAKVSDDSLTNGAGIGPEGLNELKVASSA